MVSGPLYPSPVGRSRRPNGGFPGHHTAPPADAVTAAPAVAGERITVVERHAPTGRRERPFV